MIEQIPGMPSGSLGFSARGIVTGDDYEKVIVPAIEAAFEKTRRVRLLYHLGEAFEGFEMRAMWDDTMLGLRHFTGWDRVAVVTDMGWLRTASKAMSVMMPMELRVYANAGFADAMAWIGEPRRT